MMRFYTPVLLGIVLSLASPLRAQQSGKFGIGFNVNAQKLYGDTRSGAVVYGGNPLLVRFDFTPSLFLDGDIGFSRLQASVRGTTQTSKIFHFGVKAGYRFRRNEKLNPLLYLGLGILNFRVGSGPYFWDGYGAIGGGLEYFIARSFGLNTSLDFRYTTGDDFDGGSLASGKDSFLNFAVGLNYYLNLKGLRKQPRQSHSENSDQALVEEVFAGIEWEVESPEKRAIFNREILMAQQENLLKEMEKRNEMLRLLHAKNAVMASYLKQLKGPTNPGSETVYSNISQGFQDALFLYSSQNYESASALFTRLIRENQEESKSGNLWFWLGESHFASGDYQSAVAAFQTAGTHRIEHTRALTNQMMLGLSKLKNDETSAGYTILREVLKKGVPREYEDLINDYVAEIELLPNFQL